ncbi:MAG: electron transport complex subunit RsxC [Ruminococcaceae bacterium]|nr:electron transport complex subunit RsxC [Oscillospiraceae bacterium]
MAFKLHGIKLPDRKTTEGMPSVKMPVPETVTIPTLMHIGKPVTPVVKVGTEVKVGTLIAEDAEALSAPIYSSVSGKVTKITDITVSDGNVVQAVVIASDGEMTIDENIQKPEINSKEDLISAIKKSGLVGLGGAGFPTYAKFTSEKPIETLLINGAECEPYITSDSTTMVERADEMQVAIENLAKYFNIKEVILGIEKGKDEAIKKMEELASKIPGMKVKVLPKIYPQGGEKVLVYHSTGKVIPNGKLPIDVGCVVVNCSTMAGIGKFILTGMPLVDRCITVDGGAVKEPKNVIAPIGTALKDVFDFCGGFKEEPFAVLYGGPMMGIAVPDLNVPVLKQTNAILALTKKETAVPKETSCIRCGACVTNCPFGISAPALTKAYNAKDAEAAMKAGAELCMECGCCSYNCPANRPLVQTNKLAKALVREYKAKEAK